MTTTVLPNVSQKSTSRFVQTRDWRLHYNEAGSGHPLILLHGSGPGATGWSNFAPNIPVLAEHFRVLAVDMPGWGASDPITEDNYDHVATLVQFLDALDIAEAALIGNSMGGITALRFAAEHPRRTSHLITMGSGSSPRPKMFGAGGWSEGMKILFRGYRDPSVATMRELVDVMTFNAGDAADEIAQRRADDAQAHPDHLANFLSLIEHGRGPVRKWAGPEAIAAITAPTLLIHGRDDRVVHFENSLELVSLIPDSRLVLLNRCGHWAQVEHADEFNRLVIDFITHN